MRWLLLLGRHTSVQRRNSGAAAVEFAVIVPTMIVMVAGIIDVGNAIYARMRLEAAVAAGSNYTITSAKNVGSTYGPALASNVATIITTSNSGTAGSGTVVVNNGPAVTVVAGVSSPSGTAASADLCYCPTGSPPNWVWGSSAVCGSTCASGGVAGKFVAITSSSSFAPLFTTYGLVKSGTITATAMVQAQ